MARKPGKKYEAALKQVETSPQADDFSRETPVISLTEPLKLKVDEAAWAERVAQDSGLYRTDATVKESRRNIEFSFAEFYAQETTTWLEITTLLIPGENDSPRELERLSQWIAGTLGPDVPLHFSAFHPAWKLMDIPPTPLASRIEMRPSQPPRKK